jgi:cysteinyl-tRNA synthetase
MRDFVKELSDWAKDQKPGFLVIPQNGQELLTLNGESDGEPVVAYINAIDGVGREDLFYGYSADNVATPASESEYMIDFLDLARQQNLAVLVTDYCSPGTKADDSYAQNADKGYVSFAAPSRELNTIPSAPPYNLNSENIADLDSAKNFLYLLNPESFASKSEYMNELAQTRYDVLIIDAFFNDKLLSSTDVSTLKHQSGPRDRLVIAYMSIGEAEDYRYYWQESWNDDLPSWIEEENPDWEGNYRVHYWEKTWQDIIYGADSTYLDRIIKAGFDGVYLDIIDAFEYFEEAD